MPVSTLVIVFGTWMLLLVLTVLHGLKRRDGDE